jgi:hypothetical protein
LPLEAVAEPAKWGVSGDSYNAEADSSGEIDILENNAVSVILSEIEIEVIFKLKDIDNLTAVEEPVIDALGSDR